MKRSSVSYATTAIVVLAGIGTGCGPRAGGGRASDPADASVTFHSGIVTNPATWNSLYGSWPAARYEHGMVYDSDLKRIVVFGGRAAATGPYFGDLWEWDSARGAWNQRTPGGKLPYDRCQPAMAYD